jgi:hypothetical protein
MGMLQHGLLRCCMAHSFSISCGQYSVRIIITLVLCKPTIGQVGSASREGFLCCGLTWWASSRYPAPSPSDQQLAIVQQQMPAENIMPCHDDGICNMPDSTLTAASPCHQPVVRNRSVGVDGVDAMA